MTGRRLPFQNLGPREWRNLAVAALFAFYAVYLGMGLYRNGPFVSVGSDYLAFWGAGYIANTRGYADAYDLNVLRKIQEPLVPAPDDPDLVFAPRPMLAPLSSFCPSRPLLFSRQTGVSSFGPSSMRSCCSYTCASLEGALRRSRSRTGYR